MTGVQTCALPILYVSRERDDWRRIYDDRAVQYKDITLVGEDIFPRKGMWKYV